MIYLLDDHYRILRGLLPEGAFLKLDRGDALFVTDAPLRKKDFSLFCDGYECAVRNGLMYISPSEGSAPGALAAALPEIYKYPSGRCNKPLRQRLAVALRTHNGDEARYLRALMDVLEDEGYEA